MTISMKSFFSLIIFIFAGGQFVPANAQATKPMCTLHATTEQSKGHAVIFGNEAVIPTIHLRFIDATNGKPLSPKSVDVHYYWQWLEYPYPEHAWGAWSDGEDWVRCDALEGSNELSIPERVIKPQGWYDGKYVHFPSNRKPRFDRLEIVIEREGYSPRILIQSRDLQKYKGSVATVKLSSGPPTVSFSDR